MKQSSQIRGSCRPLHPARAREQGSLRCVRGPHGRHPLVGVRLRARAILAIAAVWVLVFTGALLAQDVMPPGKYKPVDPAELERERLVDMSRAHIARIRYGGGGDWYGDPSSIPNLLHEFEARTGIPSARSEIVVELGDPGLFAHPFLYMTGHGNVKLTRDEIEKLRAHLLAGGFLWADDCYGMDASFRATVRELFPERDLVLLPLDHPIYRSFYVLDGPPKIHEHDGKPPQGFGVLDGDRLMIFYTFESDIGDGLEDADVHNDPPEKREQAIRMGVNVLYYALTRE
jgi:hypothetical protein